MQTKLVNGVRVELTSAEIAQREAELANPSAPKPNQVNRERDQRIEAGASFPVPGVDNPIPLTGRPDDRTVYLALLTRAQGLKAAGVTDPVLRLRDGADTIHMLTPDQMLALVSQAMTWFEDVMTVSWDMKDGTAPFEDGIPADYDDDKWWPDAG